MTLERLIRVAQTALEGSEADLGHVTAQTRLQEDLGLNSITMLMLMIGIEDEFSTPLAMWSPSSRSCSMLRRKRLADLPEHWDFGELTPGAQVRVRRSGYYHHGIYIGNGEIVHFDGSPNEQDAAAVRVRRTGMEEFLRGGLPELRIYGRAERKLLRAADEIAAAALSAVGRGGYDYRTNNCEHFSNECAFGEHYSRQSGEGNE